MGNSALSSKKLKLDLLPEQSGSADQNVTNSGTKPAVLPLGTVINPGVTRAVSQYEWSLVSTATRTAFSLA